MRFKNYINENIDHFLNDMPIKTQELLKKNCKKYLKLMKNTGPFYRGMFRNLKQGQIITRQVRKDRLPMGMTEKLFKRFNIWLSKNGHMRRDKSVCVISDESAAKEFGIPSYFFPIGNFSYTWIKAKDVNLDDYSTNWIQSNIDYFFDYDSDYELEMNDEDKKAFPKYFTTNKGIEIAYKNEYEIWFNCKEYYLVGV